MELSELLNKESFELRDYQRNIAEQATEKNTLVVLPTGTGKTLIAVFVAAHMLSEHPDSKVLITSPTRPLNAQHKKSFEKFTYIEPDEIQLITGKILPDDRKELYKRARIIVSTPQCIKNDLENGRISLANFSFITFDEAHRCVKDYAYTYIAKKYVEQAAHPLILGLTASPGGSREKINEIKENLFIRAVEIRSETDTDMKPYTKEIEKECVYVDFPEEFKPIKELFEQCLRDDVFWLRDHHFLQTLRPSRKALLMLQKRFGSIFSRGKNYAYFWAIMKVARAIKLEYILELIETQDTSTLFEYMQKVAQSTKKTDKNLAKDRRFVEAYDAVKNLLEAGFEHPKMTKVQEIVDRLVKEKSNVKIIIFANYRSTVEKIKNVLLRRGISAEQFIGQATRERKGLSQEKQIETLNRFRCEEFNVLVATSIGEEGLDVPAVDYAMFYEAVPSEIRTIQRRGRVGRQVAGKIIFLLTKETRDEAYYWSAARKERTMKGVLYDMKNVHSAKDSSLKTQKKKESKKILSDWFE